LSSIEKKIQEIGKNRPWSQSRWEHIFERIITEKPGKMMVWEIQSKKRPLYTIEPHEFDALWTHTCNVKATKLKDDENHIKAVFDLYSNRHSMDSDGLVKYLDQSIVRWNDNYYHLARYEDPCHEYGHWVEDVHEGIEIDSLDCFRFAKGCFRGLDYLEKNKWWLTQFDEHNIYMGSFSEDREALFKIMFKGGKDKPAKDGITASRFHPAGWSVDTLYKDYCFAVGAMILWAIFNTNGKKGEFPDIKGLSENDLKNHINNAVEWCYKPEGKDRLEKQEHKELFKVFLEDVLRPNVNQRLNAEQYLNYKWMQESQVLEDKEIDREIEENKRAKQKEEEEEKENVFA